MKLSQIDLPVLHRTGRCRLPDAPVWLLIGYPSLTAEARPVAAWLNGLSLKSNGALPIIIVTGSDRSAASAAASDLPPGVTVYLDQPDRALERAISCCEQPYVAVIRDDVVIAVGCTQYLDDLAGVVQIALLEAGIEHLDARRTLGWYTPAAAALAA